MKLKEFIKNLNEFVAENPESLNYDVVYSSDDEGNDYNRVYYTPTLGSYTDREFHSRDDQEWGDNDVNAVCIN